MKRNVYVGAAFLALLVVLAQVPPCSRKGPRWKLPQLGANV